MCFEADVDEIYLDELIIYASEFLKEESAEGSDPGLCVAFQEGLLEPELLIEFGKRAKIEVVTKAEAYALAKKLGIHLSEHGGTGQGVIGALAGVGLRLSKNDGRLKGKIILKSKSNTVSVNYIKSETNIEKVKDIAGEYLAENELIIIDGPLKAVSLDGKSTLLVFSRDVEANKGGNLLWEPCKKQQLSAY